MSEEKEDIINEEAESPSTEPIPFAETKTDGISEKNSELQKPLIEIIYDAIVSAVGGDAADQFFTMMMPGVVLNPKDYKFTGEKPARVTANESKLANVLFDPAFIANSDNGKKLYQQYKNSLNALSPKLNPVQSEMKTNLRELLLKKFPYDFGAGTVSTMTFSQVFYKLYEEYITVKSEWTAEKLKTRQDIKRDYYTRYGIDELRADSAEKEKIDHLIEDKYLEWHEAVAETRELEIEERLGKVLSIFSPGDANVINGILESGSGEEIEQARIMLRNAERLNPNGGKIYPVNMVPSNWAEYLETSFSRFDLLEGLPAIKAKISELEKERAVIRNYIEQMVSQVPDKKNYETGLSAVANADERLKEIVDVCERDGITVTRESAKSLVVLANNKKKNDTPIVAGDLEQTANENAANISEHKREKAVRRMIEDVDELAAGCYEAFENANGAILNMADLLIKEKESDIGYSLAKYVLPLKEKLIALENDIKRQEKYLQLAIMRENNNEFKENQSINNSSLEIPTDDCFTPIMISALISDMYRNTSSYANSSVNPGGESFFFGGYHSRSLQSEVAEFFNKNSKDKIQIAMNIVKVGIERDWFNPGVFQLTKDMNRFSDTPISIGNPISFTESSKEEILGKFEEMKNTFFPAYPVSFIIAKDVTIRLTAENSYSSAFSKSIENHISRGGGFLIFSSNRSNNSSLNEANVVTRISDKEITIRFKAPQILGYYMQTVSEDKSTVMGKEQIGRDDSIKTFVNAYKKFIDELNGKEPK